MLHVLHVHVLHVHVLHVLHVLHVHVLHVLHVRVHEGAFSSGFSFLPVLLHRLQQRREIGSALFDR